MADSKTKGAAADAAPASEFPARRGSAGMTVGYTDRDGKQVTITADSNGYFHPGDALAEGVLRDSFGLLTPSESEAAEAEQAERDAVATRIAETAETPPETSAPAEGGK